MSLPCVTARYARGGAFAASAAAPAVATVTQVDAVGSTSDLQGRTGDPAGFMAFNTTTSDIWVYDGTSIWFIFNNDS